jgi:hypothetical protein
MLARVFSATVNGIEAFPVEVEVNCDWGDATVAIVGSVSPMGLEILQPITGASAGWPWFSIFEPLPA